MKHNFKDLTGRTFEWLAVIGLADLNKYKFPHWICECKCGKVLEVRSNYLNSGHTKSCGCRALENRITHGMSRTRQYRIYKAMIFRCHKPTTANYSDYGGRGITVCEEWRASFETFWEDMKENYSDDLSIDRINNNKGYSKENCKWSTRKEQNNNTRHVVYLELNGEIKNIRDWAEKLGISEKSISYRKRQGWTDEKTLTRPMQYNGYKPKEVS